MIQSMTGFGSAQAHQDGLVCACEVKSVNHKFLKTVVRLPESLSALESEIDALIRKHTVRGSVIISVKVEWEAPEDQVIINLPMLESTVAKLRPMCGSGVSVDISRLLGLPGMVRDMGGDESHLSRVRPVLLNVVNDALTQLVEMRSKEGAALVSELEKHLDAIEQQRVQVAERSPEVVREMHEKLRVRTAQLLEGAGVEVQMQDVLREVALIAERGDVAEELARLEAHVDHFRQALRPERPEPVGKRLDFLAQEMLREANTIGSKAADASIARNVVELKTHIDRVKEQVQNLE